MHPSDCKKLARKLWTQHHGEIPPGMEIDHRDGNQQNNVIENLRVVNRQQNNFNRRKFKNNRSGEKGVLWDNINMRWQVRVFARPIKVYANASHKISAIVAARLIRRTLHGEFAVEGRVE